MSLASVRAALDAYARVLEDDPDDPLAACRAERDLPQALAAIDLALWDLRAKRAGVPIARADRPGRAHARRGQRDARRRGSRGRGRAGRRSALAAGFTTLKVKVGIGDDAGRLAAIRAVAPDATLRVDANGAWRTPREALANLRALEPLRLELCEEPIHGVEHLRAVQAETSIPIAMDETYAPGSGATALVCLKITRGGITQVLRDARGRARRGLGRLPRLDLRRAAGHRRGAACRRGAARQSTVWPGYVRRVRRGGAEMPSNGTLAVPLL